MAHVWNRNEDGTQVGFVLKRAFTDEQVEAFKSGINADTIDGVEAAAGLTIQQQSNLDVGERLSRKQNQEVLKLKVEFLNLLGIANQKYVDYETSMKRLSRAGRKTSRFMNKLNGYIQAYSGVVQLMNGVGPGYGDAAATALSLLFVVYSQKSRTEDLLSGMLGTLQNEFSRMQMQEAAYSNSENMTKLVAQIYALGTKFLSIAARYYSVGTIQRLWHVFSRPPSMDLQARFDEINKAISERREEIEALNGVRLYRVEENTLKMDKDVQRIDTSVQKVDRKVEKANDHIQGVETSVHELQKHLDWDRLETLRKNLNVPGPGAHTAIESYNKVLADTFGDIRGLEPLDPESRIFRRDAWKQWLDGDGSKVFLLHGQTVAPDQTALSWLSSSIKTFEGHLSRAEHEKTVFLRYFLQPREYFQAGFSRTADVHTALSTLIYQLCETEAAREILRDDQRHSKLSRDAAAMPTPPSMEEQFQLFLQVIEGLDPERVPQIVIFLDRVDLIEQQDTFWEQIRVLLRKSPLPVKCFFVMRTNSRSSDNTKYIRGSFKSGQFVGFEVHQDG